MLLLYPSKVSKITFLRLPLWISSRLYIFVFDWLKKRPTDRVNPNGEGGWFSPHFFSSSNQKPHTIRVKELRIFNCRLFCVLLNFLPKLWVWAYVKKLFFVFSFNIRQSFNTSQFFKHQFSDKCKMCYFQNVIHVYIYFLLFSFSVTLVLYFLWVSEAIGLFVWESLAEENSIFYRKIYTNELPLKVGSFGMQLPSEIGLKCLILTEVNDQNVKFFFGSWSS